MKMLHVKEGLSLTKSDDDYPTPESVALTISALAKLRTDQIRDQPK